MECFCLTLRHFSRSVCQIYDRYLAQANIQTGQLGILRLLNQSEKSVSDITELLALDQTTITRNLQVVANKGWAVPERSTSDKRVVFWRLTPEGKKIHDDAMPYWKQANDAVTLAVESTHPLSQTLPELTKSVMALEPNGVTMPYPALRRV